jgi:hypothetical protein
MKNSRQYFANREVTVATKNDNIKWLETFLVGVVFCLGFHANLV